MQDIVKFLADEIGNLTRFSKSKIEIKNILDIKKTESKKEENIIIVPSFRVDAIVAEAVHLSRSKVSEIIEEERVFINGTTCKNGAKQVNIGDKITVRGKGRFEIIEELGNTRKENIRIKIIKYI
ncbi:MAG: hypothetical protein IKP28_05985 [Clostridia bacterium]|nr:hypothetical protein [Clostridia bacterium]